jgi:formate dehydrogenase major subunit
MSEWGLSDADCIITMGSNMAENHPIAWRFAMKAKAKGATLIHVDPRFTRTGALCDLHAPIRSGSDIAFLGGIIRYILENDLWFREYAMAYTNIAAIITDRYRDAEQGDGVFSGFHPEDCHYDVDTWQYEGEHVASPLAEHHVTTSETLFGARHMANGPMPEDPTLQNPNCVYQILRRHYARYTPEMVEQATGCPKDVFLKVCDHLTRNSGRERTTAFAYAVGWTHHATGVQVIRASCIIQALLGNIGRPGGGILALRGHTSIQGSTDIPTLYNMLPTYLAQPNAMKGHRTFRDFVEKETPASGWWHNFPKYIVSLLKAWYGEHAQPENDFGFDFLPKITGDHSQMPTTLLMAHGAVKGMMVLGQNPVVGNVNSDLVERAMSRLDWLVVRDFAMTESAEFWKKGRLAQRGELKPEDIATEVFFLPASIGPEKAGTVTNTNRLVQWHDAVCKAPGDSRSESWFIYHLGVRMKRLYADSKRPRDAALQALTWEYPITDERGEIDAAAVLKEINGYTIADRKQIASFQALKDDGTTACGGWLYSGVFPDETNNRARSRVADGPDGSGSHQGWAFCWPANRREMYNRASADPEGRPWSERKRLVWWDEAKGEWTGNDVPDFEATKRPDYKPDWSTHPEGMDALSGADPFIMVPGGRSLIFVPTGLKDGPLPTHYEPVESPVQNPLYKQQFNPATKLWRQPGNQYHDTADPAYPHVLTTFRLTELHCGGIATRVMPHTAELQPEAFVEIPPELANELDIKPRDWVVLSTARGEIEVKALVTERLTPFMIGGRKVYQLGMPWVFGWAGIAHGDIANVLPSMHGDANTSIHSTKALTCALRKGRLENPGGRSHGQ